MSWTAALAIYILFWMLTLFVVLPFGVKTADEAGVEKVPGQAESAPVNFRPARVFLINTILSATLFGIWYANWTYRWLDSTEIGIIGRDPDR